MIVTFGVQRKWPIFTVWYITDFIGLPCFSRFRSGLKSHALISHDYLSQSKFVPLPRDRAAMCSRPASKIQNKICFIRGGGGGLVALLGLSSWCLVMVERLFLAVPRGCLQFVIVVFPDHTHLLFL